MALQRETSSHCSNATTRTSITARGATASTLAGHRSERGIIHIPHLASGDARYYSLDDAID